MHSIKKQKVCRVCNLLKSTYRKDICESCYADSRKYVKRTQYINRMFIKNRLKNEKKHEMDILRAKNLLETHGYKVLKNDLMRSKS